LRLGWLIQLVGRMMMFFETLQYEVFVN
jgi:hypothetical protein